MISPSSDKADTLRQPINGLRGIAILLVLFAHAGFGHIIPGGLGVMLFFVLSGFLLGQQIINESHSTGHISWHKFYLRRFWRLAPALILYIILAAATLSALGVFVPVSDIASVLGGYSNLYELYTGYSSQSPFPITWSLSVEEQFYLLLPLLFLRMRSTLPIAIFLLCTILLWRFYVYLNCANDLLQTLCGIAPEYRMLKSTDTIIDLPIYGLVAACLVSRFKNLMRSQAALLLTLCLILFTLLYRDQLFRETVRYSLQGLACALLILHMTHQPNSIICKSLATPWLDYLGRISYPLYLFHFWVLVTIQVIAGHNGSPQGIVELSSYFLASLLVAVVVYEGVEKRTIYLRRRYGSKA